MAYNKQCINCGNTISGGRHDQVFCSDRCGAAWHRRGTPDGQHAAKRPGDVHEEKARENVKACEQCGTEFAFNDYAERGGKRVPQYCSNKCRQAAYRSRKNGTTHEDVRAKSDRASAHNKRAADEDQERRKKEDAKERQRQQNYDDFRRNAARQQKPTWEEILGVKHGASWEDVTMAWREQVKQNHTDRPENRTDAAQERMKDINQAYQELKKRYGKYTRQERR